MNMPTMTLPELETSTAFLDELALMETRLDLMEKEEIETFTACSSSCQICQCVECAKIPGGDVAA